MKYLSLITFPLILLLTSCSQKDQIIVYDNTNPMKIEKATDGLNVSALLPDAEMLGEGTIAVRSIEAHANHNLDIGVFYMIEDNLITNLIENNFNVVERDPQSLDNLYRESSLNYKRPNERYDIDLRRENLELVEKEFELDEKYIKNQLLAQNKSSILNKLDGPTISDGGSAINININDERKDDKLDDNQKEVESNEEELITTSLNAASYILSYRVLECGVVYNEIEDDKKSNKTIFLEKGDLLSEEVERSSRTRLHCRLTNAKSSEIIAAGIVENEEIDIIRTEDINALKQISYEYYHHTLPLQHLGEYSESDGYAKPDDKVEINKPKSNKAKAGIRKYLMIPLFVMIFGAE